MRLPPHDCFQWEGGVGPVLQQAGIPAAPSMQLGFEAQIIFGLPVDGARAPAGAAVAAVMRDVMSFHV